MKRTISLLFTMTMLTAFLVSCNGKIPETENEKISVVTTIFPIYDWVRQIVGENSDVELTMLMDNKVDLHSYQPTAEDMVKIANCDLFLYVGGESDDWVQDALAGNHKENLIVINLLEILGDSAKPEEAVEGMQSDGEDDADEYDEHVWLSLKNATVFVREIAEKLAQSDPIHETDYAINADAYGKALRVLDTRYRETVNSAEVKTVLFGDRFPFRYLMDDYGLNYYAAFSGCSAETEASFETVVFLAGKVDELKLPAVMTLEGGDGKIAQTIVNSTMAKNASILTVNSMQSTTSSEAESGETYLGIMEQNLETLKVALEVEKWL